LFASPEEIFKRSACPRAELKTEEEEATKLGIFNFFDHMSNMWRGKEWAPPHPSHLYFVG